MPSASLSFVIKFLVRTAIVVAAFVGSACTIPVTKAHWERCEAICQAKGGMKEACVERFKGPGCHCGNDEVIWLDHITAK